MSHVIDQRQTDEAVYALAWEFIDRLSTEHSGVSRAIVEEYLQLPPEASHPDSLEDIYWRLLESAQNAHMKAVVIGGSIGGVAKLRSLLCDFSPPQVVSQFSSGEELLQEVIEKLAPTGKIRQEKQSLWPKYCDTAISGAKFLSQFSSAADFYEWANFFDRDTRARPALPMLLAREVRGFGFALACDFLKELGYANFGKPDVHVMKIFAALGLSESEKDDYQTFKAIVRVAEHVAQTPFHVDKLFWLIGSGKFYLHQDTNGKMLRIGVQRQAFIEFAGERQGTSSAR